MTDKQLPKDIQSLPVETLSYEQAFSELEIIIADLESGEHTLEEAIRLFERGQSLSQRCSSLLEEAELKVRQIQGEELVDFEPKV